MNLSEIKENYKYFDDFKIRKIASEEAASLRPEVLDILKEEIKRRGMDQNLNNSIDTQIREISLLELMDYCAQLQKHPCPNCKSKTGKLHVTIVGQVISMVFFTNYEKSIKVACSDCLDNWNKKATIKSALFGWWGFPWGPIHTVRSFIFNYGMKSNNRSNKPSGLLKSYVRDHIGVLEASKTNPQALTDFLNRTNNSN